MKGRGFSLVELVVIISIISILLTVGTISYNSWQVKYNVEKQTKEMLADLTTLRLQAIHTKKPIRLSLQTGNYAFKMYSSEAELTNFPGSGDVVLSKNLTYQIKRGDGSDISGTTIDFDRSGIINNVQIISITSPNNNAAADCLSISTALINMGKMEDGSCKIK